MRRLGNEKDKRPLLVEYTFFNIKKQMKVLRQELEKEGITFSNVYFPEERENYRQLKAVQDCLKKNFGKKAKIRRKFIHIYNKEYILVEAKPFLNNLLVEEGKEALSSPEEMVGRKRFKTTQSQIRIIKKQETLKLADAVNNRIYL